MAVKLTEEQIEFGKSLVELGETYFEVALQLMDKYGIYMHPESVRYHLARKSKPKLTEVEKLANEGIEKVLVISDIHVPFNRDDILDVVAKHAHEISAIILGGDIADCVSVSSYDPLDALPLADEMAVIHQLLKQIQDITPNVKRYLIKGNHETRWARYMAKNPNELNKLHSDNILNEVIKGFQYHDRLRGRIVTYDKLDYICLDDWFVVYNDMIVCHPITFSRVAGKTASMALDYFMERGIDFNTCLIAHTHKQSSCFKYGKYAAEIGCMCKPMGYASSGKLTYTQQQCGYHLAVFVNDKYDVNQSRTYTI